MKTEVHFCSTAFNCTEPQDYFINSCCFGDDVARWLIQQLRAQGLQAADEPGQEDFGWYLTFYAGGIEHCFVVGFQPNDPASGDGWLGRIERHAGLRGSLLGGCDRGVSPEATRAIDAALRASPTIRSITWQEPED